MAVLLVTMSYHAGKFIPRSISLMATPVPAWFTVTVAFAVTGAVIVIGNVMDLVTVPEVAVIVMVDVPTGAELLAVKVRTLVVSVGFVPNPTVTPDGRPDAVRVTSPVAPVNVIVQVAEPPCCKVIPLPHDTDNEKPDVTVSAMLVVAVNVPEVPVTVMVLVAATAVLATVNVITLVEVAGLVPITAVTPVGKPETARVTLPVNGLTSVIVMVSVPLAP
jgi:hypothetical protein